MNRKNYRANRYKSSLIDIPRTWDSGFSMFKRRIDEQLQLNGLGGGMVDDETLLPFYRMGESETYVLSALGCPVGM